MKTIAVISLLLGIASVAGMTHATITTDLFLMTSVDGSALAGYVVCDSVPDTFTLPNGMSLFNASGDAVFTGQTPPAIGPRTQLAAFDGRSAVFLDRASTQTMVYSISSSGFTLLRQFNNLLPVNRGIVLTKSETFLALEYPPSASRAIVCFDRKMNKKKWELPVSGDVYPLGKGVFCVHDGTAVSLVKKGAVIAQHVLYTPTQPFSVNPAGDFATWEVIDGTNGPISFYAKNKLLTSSATLPEAGPVWTGILMLSKRRFYAQSATTPTLATVFAYKAGSSFAYQGNMSIMNMDSFEPDGNTLVFRISQPFGKGLYVTSPDIAKTLWTSDITDGNIIKLGDGVYCRYTVSATDITARVFDKKGTIATHTFPRP